MKQLMVLNQPWYFRQVTSNGVEDDWLPATVPGNVHLDLLDNHRIEDPYWRDNENNQQWIGEADWEYKTHFDFDEDIDNQKRYELVFEGLDTYADVYLNDNCIFSADNMYTGWRVNIVAQLKRGNNCLRIYFHSVVKKTLPLYENNGFVYPANTSQPEPKLSVYSRKPGYHFGWDWGPRLVTCGIWRPITLDVSANTTFESVQFVQHALSEQVAKLSLNIALSSPSDAPLTLRLTETTANTLCVEKKIELGTTYSPLDFDIDNPIRWWTSGLGEQHLYHFKLELLSANKVIDCWQHKVGLRTIELVHEDDEYGKSFYFKLNGEPLYIKGSNCIPADFFVPRLTESDYRKMLGYAVDANMNMLRLWGGAIYEEKIFYDLCDELGILVWQDFMFACAAYPCDDLMAERIAEEAEYNVKRIRNHTSLALWCGNNEIAEGWHTWGWQERYNYSEETCEKVWGYYEKIFHSILPEAVEKFDPSRSYWASSPKFGFVDPKAKVDGDMHYWGVWFLGHKRSGFEEYLPRFMSEYGLQAMPELKTFKAFSVEEDWDINSVVLQTHQKQYANPSKNQFLDGYGMMIQYLEREYKVPKDFEQLAYMTQLLQADYLAFAIKTHRRNRPYCMGTMYWQLNDMWPVTSWASVDYFGRWKASHYAIRDTYQPIIVVIAEEEDDLVVNVVSDERHETQVTVELNLLSFVGETLYAESLPIRVKANGSTEAARINKHILLDGHELSECLLQAMCFSPNASAECISEDLYYFCLNNELKLQSPAIEFNIQQYEGGYQLEVSANTLVKNLFLILDEHIEINYFDLLPLKPKTIYLKNKPPENITYIHYQACC